MTPAVFTPPVSPSSGEPGISRALKGDLRSACRPVRGRCRTGVATAAVAVSPTAGTAVPSPAAGSQRPAAPAPSALGPSAGSVAAAGARPRGGGRAHCPRPDLSCQWRRRLGAPGVSSRRRGRRRAGRACARRNLRSSRAREPRSHRRRGGRGTGARLVPQGGGTRVAGSAAPDRPARAGNAVSRSVPENGRGRRGHQPAGGTVLVVRHHP